MTDNTKSMLLGWAVAAMWMLLMPLLLWTGSTVQELTVAVNTNTVELGNVKSLAVLRSEDRYTGSQARARNELIDEWRVRMVDRCNDNQKGIHENESAISFFHRRFATKKKDAID